MYFGVHRDKVHKRKILNQINSLMCSYMQKIKKSNLIANISLFNT